MGGNGRVTWLACRCSSICFAALQWWCGTYCIASLDSGKNHGHEADVVGPDIGQNLGATAVGQSLALSNLLDHPRCQTVDDVGEFGIGDGVESCIIRATGLFKS